MGNYRKSLQLSILKDKLYILKAFERKNALKLYIFEMKATLATS